jgi:hypothetical protein
MTITITADQIIANMQRANRAERAYRPRTPAAAPKRTQAATIPWRPHPFDPDREQRVRNQCRNCWGWQDDPRHWADTP